MPDDIILETPRMILRPFTAGDAGDVYAYARDPRVGPIAGWRPHESYMESWYIIQTVFSQPNVFAMELRENHKVIGSVGFVGGHPAGEQPNCPDDEAGYALSHAYWGRGLVPEAMGALLKYGFQQLGYGRIWCAHYEGNWRSRRVMEKCGFRYQFARPTEVELMQEVRQTYFYMLTEEAWRDGVHRALCGGGK